MADRFDFGVPFDHMTPAQKRVHNLRAEARNRGLLVEDTDELCNLTLDFTEWHVTEQAGVFRAVELRGGGRDRKARIFTETSLGELRKRLGDAEDQLQLSGSEWW
jgi:hypothetical protein